MVTQKYLWEILCYEQTGRFRWKIKPGPFVEIGDEAGYLNSDGYWRIMHKGRTYLRSRLVFLWHHGRWPEPMVDHINQNASDDRIENLREATRVQNQRNRPKTKSNTSGYVGVYYKRVDARYKRALRKPWGAKISIDGKVKYLGYFATPEEASKAYKEEAKKQFGKFYNET